MHTLIGDDDWPEELRFLLQMERLDEGGLECIKEAVRRYGVTFVIIDVFERVRSERRSKSSEYTNDYRALVDLHQLAIELEIAIVVIHHMRKAEGDDLLDTVSGTTGLTGAADAVIGLTRVEHDYAKLEGRGRDIEEFEMTLKFDGGRWEPTTTPPGLTPDQARIVEVLEKAARPMKPAEIAEACGANPATVRQLVTRLHRRGAINQPGWGTYSARLSQCHKT